MGSMLFNQDGVVVTDDVEDEVLACVGSLSDVAEKI